MDTTPAGAKPIGGLSADAFSSLFQAIGGLRNRRALAAMFIGLAGGVLLAGLFGMLAGSLGAFVAFLGGIAALLAMWTGINAAGLLLMDQARGVPSRSVVDALVYGLLCIPKVVVLALVFFAVSLVVFLALAVVYLVCKIPLLGPILFVVAFPVSVVVAGLTMWSLFICMFLSLPAIWEGAGIMRAVAQSLAIVRARLVETLLLMSMVWLLALVVGLIVFGVLGAGLVPAMTMSAGILGGGAGLGGYGGVAGIVSGMVMGGGGGSYAVAGGIGFGVLWALAATLVSQVYLLGLNLVYLRVTEGLDSGATEQALAQHLDEARRRAADMGQKAREAAERARESARHAGTPASAIQPPDTPHDPSPTHPGRQLPVAAHAASATLPPPYQAPHPAPHQAPYQASDEPPYETPYEAPYDAPYEVPHDTAHHPAHHPAHEPVGERPYVPPPYVSPHTTLPPGAYTPPSRAPAPVEPAVSPFSPAVPRAFACPACHATVTTEDVFCESCGHRLK